MREREDELERHEKLWPKVENRTWYHFNKSTVLDLLDGYGMTVNPKQITSL